MHKEAQMTELINMHKDSLDFAYNAEGDYYDLVVDKKIQRVVEELKSLPHDVLIRHLTYLVRWLGTNFDKVASIGDKIETNRN